MEKLEGEGTFFSGSGNPVADMGLPNPESLLAKAQMIYEIDLARRARGLSKAELAGMVDLDERKLVKLLKGPSDEHSLGQLARILNALDRDVTITIRERPQNDDRPARTLVETSGI